MNQFLAFCTFTKSSISKQFKPVDCNVDYSDIANFMNRPAFSKSKVVVWP
jgi:hypothetical protein